MKKLFIAALALGLATPAFAQTPAQSSPPLTGSQMTPTPTPGTSNGAAVVTRRGNVACIPPTASAGANAAVSDPCKGMPDANTDNHTVPATPNGPGTATRP
jgi:hypothetical protein